MLKRVSVVQSSRKMIILGALPPSAEVEYSVAKWAEDPSVVVLSETTSNCSADGLFASIDSLVFPFLEADFQAYAPELLLGLGTNLISKKIEALLRHRPPAYMGQMGTQQPLPATFGGGHASF